MNNVGKKFDNEKPRWDLLELELLEGVVKVLTFGASKYGDRNWQKLDNPVRRYLAAAMRHLVDVQKNLSAKDEESGLLHLDHLICNLLFLKWFEQNTVDETIPSNDMPEHKLSDICNRKNKDKSYREYLHLQLMELFERNLFGRSRKIKD